MNQHFLAFDSQAGGIIPGVGKRSQGDRYETVQTIRDSSNLNYTLASKHDPLFTGWIDGALKKALRIAP